MLPIGSNNAHNMVPIMHTINQARQRCFVDTFDWVQTCRRWTCWHHHHCCGRRALFSSTNSKRVNHWSVTLRPELYCLGNLTNKTTMMFFCFFQLMAMITVVRSRIISCFQIKDELYRIPWWRFHFFCNTLSMSTSRLITSTFNSIEDRYLLGTNINRMENYRLDKTGLTLWW